MNASYTDHPGGRFTLEWQGPGSTLVVGGKGWITGTPNRVISYSGTYRPHGNSILGIYGWTRSPLTEYYIMDNYGSHFPGSSGTYRGTLTVNGGTYTIAEATRRNATAIIDGSVNERFKVFMSVRNSKRTGGTIDVGAHFRAWEAAGMVLGEDFGYQVLACEAYYSSGSCDITVADATMPGPRNI